VLPAEVIVRHLTEHGHRDHDDGMLFVGPAAELRLGWRNFIDMTAVFTSPPEFTVLAGRGELGRIDPAVLTDEVLGDRLLLLAGRSWRVTYVDWRRRRCFVEAVDGWRAGPVIPKRLAVATLSARNADLDGATAALREPTRFVSS
jgi:ATP-dependent Lhr-like helicase